MNSLLTTSLIPRNLMEIICLLQSFLEKADKLVEEAPKICRSKHPAWEYFARLAKSDAICLLCSATVRSACSTNLSRHIIKHHPSTALQMRKAWLAGRGGVSSSATSAAIAVVESADEMNCDPSDQAYPLLVNPYSTMMSNTLTQPLLPLGIGDLSSSWLPYQDLRSLDASAAYEAELALGCSELPTHKYESSKFDQAKYDYPDITTSQEKNYDDQPRLYHKPEETKVDDELEKVAEDKGLGDSTPVKRGRPTENPCWNYFLRLDDQNVRCKLCSKVVKSACATNMTKHLERHHQHDYQHLIVQIRQYRSAKGPLVTPSEISHILPNSYSKSDQYNDIYSSSGENELTGYSQTYERTLQDTALWNRQQWAPWQQQQQLEGGIDGRTSGVIIHNSPQNWASTSTTPATIGEKPYMKRNRKTEHPVWEYFKRTQDGNAQCAICTGVVKSPCSSNFMRHLMRHHSTEYNNVYVKWVQKRGCPGTPK